MHELSVAQSIVDAVLLEADKNHAKRIEEINIDVGELMQLDTKALSDTLRILMIGPRLKGARVFVHVRSASFSCNKCDNRWGMAEARKQLAQVPDLLLVREPDSKELPLHFLPYLYSSFVHCPRCGSADISAAEGEDIRLRKLVMD
jgi:Zn finger protein HypA/HybF involved in hydrogenase expression